MGGDEFNRYSAVRLRRHGLRPLCFDGVLLARAGDGAEPQIRLYEVIDGAFAVAIEVPGHYVDAWRLESLDEVADFVGDFDPVRRLGLDIAAAFAQIAGTDIDAAARALERQASDIGPAFRRTVNSFLRVSHPS